LAIDDAFDLLSKIEIACMSRRAGRRVSSGRGITRADQQAISNQCAVTGAAAHPLFVAVTFKSTLNTMNEEICIYYHKLCGV
jgi:hypothetical protein